VTREVNSVEETWALARELAARLKPGDVVCLEGDLGAGKTTFTQGLAKAMGVSGRVTSPTFCIVQEHRAEDPAPGAPSLLVHMDLYRLRGEDDVIAIGWEDYLSEGAVLVVEWPGRAGTLIPPGAIHVSFRHLPGEERRLVEISAGPAGGRQAVLGDFPVK
jgi:tRNA threonylcarbamoyladenosine biosynthesis protein TsaE